RYFTIPYPYNAIRALQLVEKEADGETHKNALQKVRNKTQKVQEELEDMRNELEKQMQQNNNMQRKQKRRLAKLQLKQKLEKNLEKMREDYQRELDEKDNELDAIKGKTMQRLVEATGSQQLSGEKTSASCWLRDQTTRLQSDRRISPLLQLQQTPKRDVVKEKKLKRELHKTRALLKDAQSIIEHKQEKEPKRDQVKQIKKQLEEAELGKSIAIKAKQTLEEEVQELQQQLEDIHREKRIASAKRLKDTIERIQAERLTELKAQQQQGQRELDALLRQVHELRQNNNEMQHREEEAMQKQVRRSDLDDDDKQDLDSFLQKQRSMLRQRDRTSSISSVTSGASGVSGVSGYGRDSLSGYRDPAALRDLTGGRDSHSVGGSREISGLGLGGGARDRAGGSFRDSGSSLKDGLGSFRDGGGSFRDSGSSIRDSGGSLRDSGGSFRDGGGSFRDSGGSLRRRDFSSEAPSRPSGRFGRRGSLSILDHEESSDAPRESYTRPRPRVAQGRSGERPRTWFEMSTQDPGDGDDDDDDDDI
ncbi:PREDICTED: unconventional myosin-XVIIIa-like, partial [Priapulus caudatus]|uniref:Unconventional myosin-XVIIIa-like n=1 Tax=Priapulus caudatus TaxID=37621 RepID=A0ABM1EMA2_PRICU